MAGREVIDTTRTTAAGVNAMMDYLSVLTSR
jgi:hypothetical protein